MTKYLSDRGFVRPSLQEEDDYEYEFLLEEQLLIAHDHLLWYNVDCPGLRHYLHSKFNAECNHCEALYGNAFRSAQILKRCSELEHVTYWTESGIGK